MVVEVVSQFVSHHELQFARFETLEQVGGEHHEKPSFLRFETCGVEGRTGEHIKFEGYREPQLVRTLGCDIVQGRGHGLSQPYRGRKQVSANAEIAFAFALGNLLIDFFDERIFEQLFEHLLVVLRAKLGCVHGEAYWLIRNIIGALQAQMIGPFTTPLQGAEVGCRTFRVRVEENHAIQ